MGVNILVCGSGPVSESKLFPLLNDIDLVIAANGGYEKLKEMSIDANIVCGDMDSVGSLKEGVQKIVHAPEKDRSDFQLCLDYIFENISEIDQIIVTGIVSERRLDHTLANIFICFNYEKNITIISPYCVIRIVNVTGEYNFKVGKGSIVSIISTWGGDIYGEGLKYKLSGALKSPSHGISNVAVEDNIKIRTEGGRWALITTEKDEEI